MTRNPYTTWTSLWLWLGMAHWLSVSKQMPPMWAAIAMGYHEPRTPEQERDAAFFTERVSKGL